MKKSPRKGSEPRGAQYHADGRGTDSWRRKSLRNCVSRSGPADRAGRTISPPFIVAYTTGCSIRSLPIACSKSAPAAAIRPPFSRGWCRMWHDRNRRAAGQERCESSRLKYATCTRSATAARAGRCSASAKSCHCSECTATIDRPVEGKQMIVPLGGRTSRCSHVRKQKGSS